MDASSWSYPETYRIVLGEGEKPLPMGLLDLGYDVWLTNMRGTKYSRKHETLDSSDPYSEYWKVAYVGVSLGTTIMFYALTQETEETYFADNMSVFIALAPCMISPQAPYDYETFIATEW